MAQVTTGILAILNISMVYDLLMNLLGAKKLRRIIINQYVKPQPGDRILDIGCGTGTTVEALPKTIEYIGVDLSAEYIAMATRRYGHLASFKAGDVNQLSLGSDDRFDIVVALGLLHHLDDDEVVRLAKTVRTLLKANGRFISVDNCFTDDQSAAARALIKRDRGRNVRTPGRYVRLLEEVFDGVTSAVRHDLLRVPYTHVIIESAVP